LLRIKSFDELLGMPFLGASFEAYVLEQIIAEKPNDIELFFYRTQAGTEIDIVLAKGIKPIACIEVKFTSAPKVTKGLINGIDDLKTDHNYIVIPTKESYPIKDNILVCGIEYLIEQIKKI